jgi:hypothetical protein
MPVVKYLNNTTDIAPATGGWTDVDVSSSVPSGATGVIVRIVNTGIANGGTRYMGLRNNGSTDATRDYIRAASTTYAYIGIDSSRIFEAWKGNDDIEMYLHGYFESPAEFFTNAIDKSIGSTTTWTDVDISSDTGGDTAIGAILLHECNFATASKTGGYRKNGSTDTNIAEISSYYNLFGFIVGVDGSEIFEGYISTLDIDTYLVGYITDDATFQTNSIDVEPSTTGSYQDMTALTATIPLGGIYFVGNSGAIDGYGIRKKGETYDFYDDILGSITSDCDMNGVCQARIESTGGFLQELGAFELDGTQTNDERDAKVTGKDSANDERSAITAGGDGWYREYFDNTTYKDAVNTTAEWDGDGSVTMTPD